MPKRDGIENFWGYAKDRLSKFKGIKKEIFLLHLKECEFRYKNNKDTKTFYHILVILVKRIRLIYLEPKIFIRAWLTIRISDSCS